MTPDRLERVQEIFLEAVARTGEARRELVRARCAGDTALQTEVEALLAHDEGEADRVLTAPLVAPGLLPRNLVEMNEAGQLKAGTRVGAYTIVGFLGSGGMGAVYIARQESPRRTVALKVLRPGAASAGALRRMEMEAELLGRLKHPGIAQIFEAGRADYGLGPQPFFAMELVEGPPLTQYAADRELDTRERLSLMLKVCEAIEHAHQKGVIHRDLKPGNILVDQAGRPKVVDFGIARDVDAEIRVTTLRTGHGALIGTLAYMSPEQATGDPAAVDTRSDVYALGVVMYQLLAGRLPHDLESRPIPDAARAIREEEPPRLGTVDRSLRGDVEVIVSRALAKDPERRYQSAAELAADIRRHLAGEPIEARRDSAVYVLRKRLRRNAAAVAVVSVLIIGLSLFSVYARSQAAESRRLAERATAQRARAELLREQAERQGERLRRSFYFNRIGFALAALAASDAPRMHRLLEECPEDLRGWEWRYMRRLSDQSSATAAVRPVGMGGAAVSRDGKRLAAWRVGAESADLWEGKASAAVENLSPGFRIGGLALDGDGGRWAAGGQDGTAGLWRTGETEPVWRRGLPLSGIRACEFSADGRLVVVAGQGREILILDAADGAIEQRLDSGRPAVDCVALSPDGRWAACGTSDGAVRVFDLRTGSVAATPPPHERDVRAVAFSADSAMVATCSDDGALRMARLVGGRWQGGTVYRVHSNKVSALAFSPDGTRLASAGTEAAIRIITLADGNTERSLFGHTQTVASMAYTPDGMGLISTARDGTAKWWDLAARRGDVTASLPGAVVAMAVTGDGGLLAAGDTGSARRLSLAGLEEDAGFKGGPRITRSIGVSPDGRVVATAGTQNALQLWDAASGRALGELEGHEKHPYGVAFLPDGRLVSAGLEGTLRVWDLGSRRQARSTQLPEQGLNDLAVDPSGRLIAVSTSTGPVYLVDAGTGAVLGRLEGHAGGTRDVAFFADGARLATAGFDSTAKVWDVAERKELLTLRGHTGAVLSVAVLPDQSRIATGSLDNTVRLWDALTGEEVLLLRHHTGGVYAVLFTPDGKALVSAGDEGSVRVWRSEE